MMNAKTGSELLDLKNEEKLNEDLKDLNTVEFILDFIQYGKPSLDYIVSYCPLLKERIHSIASPKANVGSLPLYVASVAFGPKMMRHGICTLPQNIWTYKDSS